MTDQVAQTSDGVAPHEVHDSEGHSLGPDETIPREAHHYRVDKPLLTRACSDKTELNVQIHQPDLVAIGITNADHDHHSMPSAADSSFVSDPAPRRRLPEELEAPDLPGASVSEVTIPDLPGGLAIESETAPGRPSERAPSLSESLHGPEVQDRPQCGSGASCDHQRASSECDRDLQLEWPGRRDAEHESFLGEGSELACVSTSPEDDLGASGGPQGAPVTCRSAAYAHTFGQGILTDELLIGGAREPTPLSGGLPMSLSGDTPSPLSGGLPMSLSGDSPPPLSGGLPHTSSLSGDVPLPLSGGPHLPLSGGTSPSLSGDPRLADTGELLKSVCLESAGLTSNDESYDLQNTAQRLGIQTGGSNVHDKSYMRSDEMVHNHETAEERMGGRGEVIPPKPTARPPVGTSAVQK